MSQSDKGPPVPKQQDSSTAAITVPSVSIKVINPDKKSESKLFILRNVELRRIETPESMRSLLTEKLGQDLVAKEPGFEMGYFQSNKCVWVRNQGDIKVVITVSKDSHCFTLWCMEKSMSKRVIELSDSDSDGGLTIPQPKRKKSSKYSEKLEQIDDTVDELHIRVKCLNFCHVFCSEDFRASNSNLFQFLPS